MIFHRDMTFWSLARDIFCWKSQFWFRRSRVKFNFAHDYQSLIFFAKTCQDFRVEVKVEIHLIGTHRVFSISRIATFSESWWTRYHHTTFWNITICQLSTEEELWSIEKCFILMMKKVELFLNKVVFWTVNFRLGVSVGSSRSGISCRIVCAWLDIK